ncbi:MAG: methionine adenosyltransferase [Ignavibacteriales bacterium]|nr:MAG: methionine adenosyltransferase [Ignavibacteriaceae bacterium]MBW7873934.1 methionine adenosyltransferase [Ignavibacteria bacterium]MCZ2143307.1 methionine adenosyltransferase [Ignavibacteriales bacterium]OQY76323.1 MAG: methionine adenosyltransferase [Ignavibacteriales bacterium UTCHB3]MBV6444190.1 S-adenosylmethionine synthase [Ignavibacteriaceae bacterium]
MSFFFTSESVSEGHPDKLCDAISDAVLDAIYEQDPESRVACETYATTGLVVVGGEISTNAYIDLNKVVRETINEIGYTKSEYKFAGESVGIVNVMHEQSRDIAMGVDKGGAGDQGIMFGFACDQTEELMPLPIMLAHKLVQKLTDIRKNDKTKMRWLRPDSKSQVTIEYSDDKKPLRVEAVVISTQHDGDVDNETIRAEIIEHVIKAVIPANLLDENTKIHINPTGKFEIGGPHGDTGLTGRKIIVDTYGGWAPHGGGAFSGKDPSKVDRSATYAARHIAKNVVAAGLAKECLVQVAYAIGVAEPVSIFVNTYGTGKISDEKIAGMIQKEVDLTPAGIIERLQLRRPVYKATAAYGHFGRNGNGFTWEKLDLVDTFKKYAE